jgi:hypothetical protein
VLGEVFVVVIQDLWDLSKNIKNIKYFVRRMSALK